MDLKQFAHRWARKFEQYLYERNRWQLENTLAMLDMIREADRTAKRIRYRVASGNLTWRVKPLNAT